MELAEDRRRGRKTESTSRGHADLRVSYDHDAARVSIRAHTGSWIGALSSFRSVVVQVARSLVATPATTAAGNIVNIGHFLSVDRSVLRPWWLAATATSQPTTVGAQDGCGQPRSSQVLVARPTNRVLGYEFERGRPRPDRFSGGNTREAPARDECAARPSRGAFEVATSRMCCGGSGPQVSRRLRPKAASVLPTMSCEQGGDILGVAREKWDGCWRRTRCDEGCGEGISRSRWQHQGWKAFEPRFVSASPAQRTATSTAHPSDGIGGT